MKDSDIIAMYNARDERAITVTEQRYGTYCMGIAQNILKNLQDSEECVNDTWLVTWNSISGCRIELLSSVYVQTGCKEAVS